MPSDSIGWFLDNLSRTAIHEGGHLVAHLLYRGAYIDRMTVHPWSQEGPEGPRFFAGCVNTGLNVYAPISSAPPEQREFRWSAMRDRLKECAAGIVAERYEAIDADDAHAEGDREAVAMILTQLLGEDATAELIDAEWVAAQEAVKADFDLLGGAAFFEEVAGLIISAHYEAGDRLPGDVEEIWIEGELMEKLTADIGRLLTAVPQARDIRSAYLPEGWRP